jgi:5-methylthioadenosine/S-adenosylhomocysteine deaminase
MSDMCGGTQAGAEPGRHGAGAVQPCSLIVRGRAVIANPLSEDGTIEDGAVCVQGDQILAVGRYERLRESFIPDRELGSPHHLVMPGLINAHDHIRGPSAFQMGIPDDSLEPWLLDLLRLPEMDPYLSAAYACTQLIESGVTTVLHSFFEGGAGRYEATLAATARAFCDSGIRAVVALTILDRSIVASILRAMLPHLPADLEAPARDLLSSRHPITVDEYFAVLRGWHADRQSERFQVMVGPVSVHWCSEDLLLRIWQEAADLDVPVQTHLLESRTQQIDSLSRYGKSAVEYLAERGLLSPRLSCAHCVWVTEHDMDLLAASGTSVIHNPSSNLRLCNGTAPVRAMLQKGINVALGLDSQGLNDEADMIQELRLAALLHRAAGDPYPGPRQALAMATLSGARALGMEHAIGTLAPGKRADLILVDLDRLEAPFSDLRLGIADRVVQRAKAQDVDTVIVNGEVVMHNRKHLKIDTEALARELKTLWARERSAEQMNLDGLLASLKPYARRLSRGQIRHAVGAGPFSVDA